MSTARRLQVGQCVEHCGLSVEVGNDESADVARHQRIQAGVRVSGQMRGENIVGHRQIIPRTVLPPSAFDCWYPSCFAGTCVFPTQRVDVVSSGEQRAVQRELALYR
jgi:hypothetical protein